VWQFVFIFILVVIMRLFSRIPNDLLKQVLKLYIMACIIKSASWWVLCNDEYACNRHGEAVTFIVIVFGFSSLKPFEPKRGRKSLVPLIFMVIMSRLTTTHGGRSSLRCCGVMSRESAERYPSRDERGASSLS
jgi:hypothetical protein